MKRSGSIYNYFQSNGSKSGKNEDSIKNLIKKRIKEDKQEDKQDDGSVIDIDVLKNKVVELEKKNAQLQNDNKDLKYLLNKATKINLQKDLLIEQLKKQISGKDLLLNQSQNKISGNHNIGNRSDSKGKQKNELLFKEYEKIIDEADLCRLRSVGDDKVKDSKFIVECLETLYKENVSILCERTAQLPTAKKKELTPEKKTIIENLFSARLNSLNLSAQDQLERKSKFRYLLNTGISTIRRRPSTSNKQVI